MTVTAAPAASDTSRRPSALAGLRDTAPIILGMVPFGLVAGIAAVDAGLPGWGASVFSVLIFAGASQIAGLALLGQDAAVPAVLATVVVINARFLMYSASLALPMQHVRLRDRMAMAYLLTDQSYAVTITELNANPARSHRAAYFLGGAVPLWLAWQTTTVIGAMVGSAIPPGTGIEFAIPLVFASLLVPAVTDRPMLAAAVCSALVATAGSGLPSNAGLLLGAATGITVGYLLSRRADRTGQQVVR